MVKILAFCLDDPFFVIIMPQHESSLGDKIVSNIRLCLSGRYLKICVDYVLTTLTFTVFNM